MYRNVQSLPGCLTAEKEVPEQIGEVNFELEIVPSDLVWQGWSLSVPGPEGNMPSVWLVHVTFLSEQLAVRERGGGPGISSRYQCVVWT